jgi:polyribonucleotide nucleotidyltransferase
MDVFRNAFKQSIGAIDYILTQMLAVQDKPSEKLSKYAPLILSYQLPVSKISSVI